ncbi:hypothetical protein [Thermococcus sp.]
MVDTLEAYLRNGELFLKAGGIEEVTPEVIKEKYLLPVEAMTLHQIPVDSESDAVAVLRAFGFELSGKTKEILPGLTKGRKGTCSICGRKGEVVPNRAFIFPFERKIDSVVGESNRLSLCPEHAFGLYSGMAYLYLVPLGEQKLKFFFDAPERILKRVQNRFREFWKDHFFPSARKSGEKTHYSISVSLTLSRTHPNEAFFAIIHEFVKFLKNRRLLEEAVEEERLVRAHLVGGSGQFYEHRVIEGTTLQMLMAFLSRLQESGNEVQWGRRHLDRWDSAVVLFYENLEVPRGRDRAKNTLEREEFIKKLLEGKFDFVLLNQIFMERLRRKLPLPGYYSTWAVLYLEAFGGGYVDAETFRQVNGLGYALGRRMKGSNLERYLWELFRARGFEEFLNRLVELQAKVGESIDLRAIYENRREWKVVKAILLNGMLNALYGGGKE